MGRSDHARSAWGGSGMVVKVLDLCCGGHSCRRKRDWSITGRCAIVVDNSSGCLQWYGVETSGGR